MLWFIDRSRLRRGAVVVALGLGLTVPAFAGNVYTWNTDEGTVAFTDDPKHIPSRYRDSAETRQVGKLEEYARYTPAQTVAKRESAEQQAARTGDAIVRNATASMAVGGGASVIVGGTRYGRGGMVVPIQGSDSHEPLVIERRRVKPSNSMATRHETITRRGNEIISIDRDELHQREHSNMVPPVD
jgi:hypothetical protein